ncbi:MAG: hypothetical protein IPP79_18025 [Chitinophagaceae bacterium]|nr:hypothetical protein [Chitinophagaceae bacterium]
MRPLDMLAPGASVMRVRIGCLDQMGVKVSDEYSDVGPIRGTGTSRSAATFDFSNGMFVIKMASGSNAADAAHEFKHAYQFEIGEYSVGMEILGYAYPNFFYDKFDELAAYQRGNSMGKKDRYNINNLAR